MLPRGSKPGRPPIWTRRQLIDDIRFCTRTGVPWRDVPERYVPGPGRMTCSAAGSGTAPGSGSSLNCRPRPTPGSSSPGTSTSTPPCAGPTSTPRGRGKGDLQVEPPGGITVEPDGHGLGRSSGGLTTKLHLAVEQGQKPMAIVITAGQRGDSPQFESVLKKVRIARSGAGRPRTRPNRVRADKAYASRKNRAYLRRRGIRCTIPDKADQAATARSSARVEAGRPSSTPRTTRLGTRSSAALIALKAPRRGHQVRQTRGPLRGDHPRRSHQRVAATSTFDTRPRRGPSFTTCLHTNEAGPGAGQGRGRTTCCR
ncbi:transposase [Streptomyces sp. NPDC051921]|uniref:transposase n=1 Tax=Streptomyces sp. NPDC051921 TaxID=3155806 RepID=UPI00341AD060